MLISIAAHGELIKTSKYLNTGLCFHRLLCIKPKVPIVNNVTSSLQTQAPRSTSLNSNSLYVYNLIAPICFLCMQFKPIPSNIRLILKVLPRYPSSLLPKTPYVWNLSSNRLQRIQTHCSQSLLVHTRLWILISYVYRLMIT